ncbi:MAG: CRTAC1 family protein, partial [Bdellovibrionales bacterium]|nr:CRTAC1 family protein [Bdellovibrionales bacterium]
MSAITATFGNFRNYFGTFYKAQHFQIAALLFYVFVGALVLNWPKTLDQFFLMLASNMAIDYLLRRFVFPNVRSYPKGQLISPSIIIISCGTFLLTQGYSTWAYIVAGAIGVSTRYLFTIQGHPIFNPANIGVLSISLAFPMLGSSFSDQWVGHFHLIAFMIAMGLATAFFAKKLVLCLAYVAFFLLFAWLRTFFFLPEVMILTMASLLGAPSVLFLFHMMTDPRTSPPEARGQLFYGAALAGTDLFLRTKAILFPQLIALAVITIGYAVVKGLQSKKPNVLRQTFFATLCIAAILTAGVLQRSLPFSDPFYAFQKEANASLPISFQYHDVTSEMGITFNHDIYNSKVPIQKAQGIRFHPSAAVAVADINGDGFYDLFFTTMKDGQPNALYLNDGGKRFKDVTKEWGLETDTNTPWPSAAANFLDIDNDGDKDLFIARAGCHSLYVNVGGRFEDQSAAAGIDQFCSHARAVNYLDFNLDGRLDIYVGNFLKPGILSERGSYADFDVRVGATNYNREGGDNFLFANTTSGGAGSGSGGGSPRFTEIAKEFRINDPGLNWAIGVMDKNGDFFPDLYLANDFGVDTFYINSFGRKFSDLTSQVIGRHTSRNSMSVETADFDGDLEIDIYATQMSRLGSPIGKNLLWNSKMQNIAPQLNADKCGWGWGAKFFDPNNDGNLDLLVANGYFKGTEKKPYWYQLFTLLNLPAFLREGHLIDYPIDRFSLADEQPNCLFLNEGPGKPLVDVAKQVGITDLYNGRGAATVDFDNDGRMDFVIANHMGPPVLYHNRPNSDSIGNKANWFGVQLKSRCHKPIEGTKVFATCAGKTFFRELYPANGFNAQSDDRIHFGLGDCAQTEIAVETFSPYTKTAVKHTLKTG